MQRIILGLSMLFMLAQNVFAESDISTYFEACNKDIKHPRTASVSNCLKVLHYKEKHSSEYTDKDFAASYLNIGLIYDETGDDLKGYKYYMKAAKLDGSIGIQAQKNLNIMCKESPWACK